MNKLRVLLTVALWCFLLLFAKTSMAYERDDQKIIIQWVLNNAHKSVTKTQATRIVKAAYQSAKAWKVDPLLLLAIMKPESNYKASARNTSTKASGLMQVIPRWHRSKIGSRQIMNVEVNIDVGAAIISDYLVSNGGKMSMTLARYSGGGNKAYYTKVSKAYQSMKTVLVLDRFENERAHTTDHILQQPGAYTTNFIADQPKMAYVKNSDESEETFLLASHP